MYKYELGNHIKKKGKICFTIFFVSYGHCINPTRLEFPNAMQWPQNCDWRSVNAISRNFSEMSFQK